MNPADAPVEISAETPISFKMADGSVIRFKNYSLQEGPHGPLVEYTHGCVRGELAFKAQTTIGQIYAAIIENQGKLRGN